MSFTFGVYDLFAYTLPGILYLYIGNEFLKLYGATHITYEDVSNIPVAIMVIIFAYILGNLLDFLADRWRSFHKKRGTASRAIDELKKLYPDLNIEFRPYDRTILFAIIRRYHDEITATADRNKAISILFQNVSFGFFLYAIILSIQLFKNGYTIENVFILIVSIVLSILARQRSKVFNLFFNSLIFEVALTYGTSAKEIIKQTQSDSKNKKGAARNTITKKARQRSE